MNIKFTPTFNVSKDFYPTPASAKVPEWYKLQESYNGVSTKKPDGSGKTTATIKRCMPVFDAICSGYLIYSYVDVYVSQQQFLSPEGVPLSEEELQKKGGPSTYPSYEWPAYEPVQFHPVIQAPLHPGRKNLSLDMAYPKWISPWSIHTPKGYSVLITPPMHHNLPFTILSGVVDTDTYHPPVNFPFVFNDWGFEGMIPAGTPIAQITPFKRDSWSMKVGDQKDLAADERDFIRISFFDEYKNKYRQTKQYK